MEFLDDYENDDENEDSHAQSNKTDNVANVNVNAESGRNVDSQEMNAQSFIKHGSAQITLPCIANSMLPVAPKDAKRKLPNVSALLAQIPVQHTYSGFKPAEEFKNYDAVGTRYNTVPMTQSLVHNEEAEYRFKKQKPALWRDFHAMPETEKKPALKVTNSEGEKKAYLMKPSQIATKRTNITTEDTGLWGKAK